VAVNVAVVADAATVTDAGTVSAALFDDRATADPPDGAAPLRVTVQVEVAPDVNVPGLHCTPETPIDWATVIAAPVPVNDSAFPVGSVALKLPIPIGTDPLGAADRVTVSVATTPFGIVAAFMPDPRQMIEPVPLMQVRDFPAPVSAGPAATLAETIFAGEYEKAHSRPEGWLDALRDKFRDTDPPAVPEPEARVREALCPKAAAVAMKAIQNPRYAWVFKIGAGRNRVTEPILVGPVLSCQDCKKLVTKVNEVWASSRQLIHI
jgi:hypothetical protein